MYNGLEAELHDIFWEAEAPGVELELIRKFLSGGGDNILEVGCGSGRLMIPLLEEEFSIDGVEPSPEMLRLFRKSLKEQHGDLTANLFLGTVLDVDLRKYKCVLIPAFTLMLMSKAEALETLKYIYEHTAAGSRLFITTFMPWAEICGELVEGKWYKDHDAHSHDGEQASCQTKFRIDRTNQSLHRKHRYTKVAKNGKKITHKSEQVLRWYSYQELVLLLEHAGWRVDESIYDFDLEADGKDAHLFTLFSTSIK